MIHTIDPTRAGVRDVYTVEPAPEGVYIEHNLVDETGWTDLRSRATLMIEPSALPEVIQALQRCEREMRG